LTQRGGELPVDLIPKKVRDHGRDGDEFRNCLSERVQHLWADDARAGFLNEMRRFLPSMTVEETLQKDGYWQWLRGVVIEQTKSLSKRASQSSTVLNHGGDGFTPF
jgi:hypothetical protein